MRDLLGGKGANVAEMTRILGAERVPAGFTITTEACVAYMRAGRRSPTASTRRSTRRWRALEEQRRQAARRPRRPAARLRALGRARVDAGDARHRPQPRPQRRVGRGPRRARPATSASPGTPTGASCRCSATSCAASPGERFEAEIAARQGRPRRQARHRARRRRAARARPRRFKALLRQTGEDFPQDPREQLAQAIRAVFDSWIGDRAVAYRRINRIPDDWGTAVNVQQMVFGNKGDTSGSGVAFSRDEVTGAPEPSRRLPASTPRARTSSPACATRATSPSWRDVMPEAHAQLMEILRTLEAHYGDMQDTEFTIEEGRLYMLQTRNAKRPAQAAVRFAVDAVDEGLLDKARGAGDDRRRHARRAAAPDVRPDADYDGARRAASPPRPARPRARSSSRADDAVAAAADGRDVILVRPFTEADDVAGFHAAQGILTTEGGKASHAALVARGMGVPGGDRRERRWRSTSPAQRGARRRHACSRAGDRIAIDGTTGDDHDRRRPARRARDERATSSTVLDWADELRTLGVRTNADTPEDAAQGARVRRRGHRPVPHRAHVHGRRPPAEDARDDPGRRRRGRAAPRSTSCCRCSRRTSRGSSRRWTGCRSRSACSTRRCTSSCRTHDPRGRARAPSRPTSRARAHARARRSLQEVNPMLGTRGCRLGILLPGDLRDAGRGRSCAPRARCASAPATRRSSRS